MDRRTLIRHSVGAGIALLAGCMGSTGAQEDTLSVANIDFYENDAGYLEIAVIVSNAGNTEASGTLLVHAKIDGDARPRVREISLDAHATREYTIEYDVKMADVSNLDVSATIEQG